MSEQLQRYGLQWNGSKEFVCTPLADGYWTPWHLAQDMVDKSQRDLALANKQLDLHSKYRMSADGNWIDGFGACRVCNGEIPYGHVGDCDVYKMEQTTRKLQARIDALMLEYCPDEMTPEQKANYEANQTAEG